MMEVMGIVLAVAVTLIPALMCMMAQHRRIRNLEYALTMKNTLAGVEDVSISNGAVISKNVAVGDTLSVKFNVPAGRVEIQTDHSTRIQVVAFSA